MNTIQERSSDPNVYRDQVRDVVMSRWERGRADNDAYYKKVPRWYESYRGIYSGKHHPFRNNINLPLLFATVQTDVARKVQMTFGANPIVEMQGVGPEDAPAARKNESLLQLQAKDCGSFTKAVDFYVTADLYGTAVLQYGWKHQVNKDQKIRVPTSGQVYGDMSGYQIITRDVERFNGPDWNVLDLLDVCPAVNSKRIQDMDYFIVRYWLDLDQIEALAKEDFFDKSQVEELKNRGGTSNTYASDEYKDRRAGARSPLDEASTKRLQKFAKPVQLIEMWGTLPDELIPKDGIKNRLITIAEGKVVLRNDPNPHWTGDKPFISYSPMPDPHYFFAAGKIEMNEKMQFTANRLANQKLDALDLLIDPVLLYDKNRFTNKQELYIRSGKPIGVDGNPAEVIQPLTLDMRGVQLAYHEVDQLWQWVEQGSGVIRDTIGGQAITKRQTAREFQGRQDSALTRLGMEARIGEEDWIEPLFNAFRSMNRQWLPLPRQIKMLGQSAEINPITGAPMPPEPTVLDYSDIAIDYDVRAVGASQQIGRAAKQQNMNMALQVIGGTPLARAVNWIPLGRQYLGVMDFQNVDEILAFPSEPNGPPAPPDAQGPAGADQLGAGAPGGNGGTGPLGPAAPASAVMPGPNGMA